MFKFYRNLFLTLLTLSLVTASMVYVGFKISNMQTRLVPGSASDLTWEASIEPKQVKGETWLQVVHDLDVIEYVYNLDSEQKYPYSHYSMVFVDDAKRPTTVDLTRFDRLSFKIACQPENVLLLVLFTFDEVTTPDDPATRRVSSAAFSCDEDWKLVHLRFTEIITPDWWLEQHGHAYSERRYAQDKAMGIAIVNSLQSPVDTVSRVRLGMLSLQGDQPGPMYAAIVVSVLSWLITALLMVRYYVRSLTAQLHERLNKDQPLIAYKKLTIESQKDKNKDKENLLRYIAKEYDNADLNLESAAATLGINRTKINELLKQELGLTFIAYLNKLRLTEAARLLAEKDGMSVSKIAYSVGYNNVSYFNKLFKQEYGCTPKTFKKLSS